MRIGLSVYGTTFGMGIDPLSGRPVISPRELMDQAITAGYSSRLRRGGMIQTHSLAPLTWALNWVRALFARWLGEQSSAVTGGL